MNDQLTTETLMALIEEEGEHVISLYMPTHRATAEAEEDPIRFRNLVDEAETQLQESGLSRKVIRQMLAAVRGLQDDSNFWHHQSDGLAYFIAGETRYCFRLPLTFDELVAVGDHCHIKPLLPLLTPDGRFYVLALSQNNVRFFQATRQAIEEIVLDDMPTTVAEALPYDEHERQLQFHTGTGAQKDGGRAAIFHGHGLSPDDNSDAVLRFYRQVDDSLMAVLASSHAPLVLAGVDEQMAIYREASRYDHILQDGIGGNPEALSAEELQTRAWSIVEPVFRKSLDDALANYHRLAAQELASCSLSTVVEAAYAGRIDTAFTALGQQLWGTFDIDTFAVKLDEASTTENTDLFDAVARQTLKHGGVVYALDPDEMPENADVAALFRY